MTKEEFLKLTGIQGISDRDFDNVFFAFVQIGYMSKETFCDLYVNNKTELLGKMAKRIREVRSELEDYNDRLDCFRNVTEHCLRAINENSLTPIKDALEEIEECIGTKEMILHKIFVSDFFTSEDMQYFTDNCK